MTGPDLFVHDIGLTITITIITIADSDFKDTKTFSELMVRVARGIKQPLKGSKSMKICPDHVVQDF